MIESERVFASFVGVRGAECACSWLSRLANEPPGLDALDSVAVRRSMRFATLDVGFVGLGSSFPGVKSKRLDRSLAAFAGEGDPRRWEVVMSGSVSERETSVGGGLASSGLAISVSLLVETTGCSVFASDAGADEAGPFAIVP